MLDCTAADLLGSVEDRRAYLPPKAIHGAEAEATIRLPASIHNWVILSPKGAGWGAH